MGGGGHEDVHDKIPDWRKFKVEDVPELVKVQHRLAALGLKDPWLRNHVWKYDPGFGTKWSRIRGVMFRGFKWGVLALALTIGAEKVRDMVYPSTSHHDDHGDHH